MAINQYWYYNKDYTTTSTVTAAVHLAIHMDKRNIKHKIVHVILRTPENFFKCIIHKYAVRVLPFSKCFEVFDIFRVSLRIVLFRFEKL